MNTNSNKSYTDDPMLYSNEWDQDYYRYYPETRRRPFLAETLYRAAQNEHPGHTRHRHPTRQAFNDWQCHAPVMMPPMNYFYLTSQQFDPHFRNDAQERYDWPLPHSSNGDQPYGIGYGMTGYHSAFPETSPRYKTDFETDSFYTAMEAEEMLTSSNHVRRSPESIPRLARSSSAPQLVESKLESRRSRSAAASGPNSYPSTRQEHAAVLKPHRKKLVAIHPSRVLAGILVKVLDLPSAEPDAFQIELRYEDIHWIVNTPSKLGKSLLANALSFFNATSSLTLDEKKRYRRVISTRQALENYLFNLIRRPDAFKDLGLRMFLEISAISMVYDMGWKGKEGYMNVNSVEKWVILRDSYLAICDHIESNSPCTVLLFDKELQKTEQSEQIVVRNSTEEIILTPTPATEMGQWREGFKKILDSSPWIITWRFNSFAPIRQNAKAKWFVDGHDYFETAASGILNAKFEIFIAGWWLSPELHLRRPVENNDYRLDKLLHRRAKEGIKIYIVLYDDWKHILKLDSQYTKKTLEALDEENIIVLEHRSSPEYFWLAHHEKILVIDQRLAFVGGLDFGYGRYDTPAHNLTDFPVADTNNCQVFPGKDYANQRVMDFENVHRYYNDSVDRTKFPRMPWHDIQVGMNGQPARDVARHFIQRWNFIVKNVREYRGRIPMLLPKGEDISVEDEDKFKETCDVQVIRSVANWSQGVPQENSIYEAYKDYILNSKYFIYIENQFFITSCISKKESVKNKIGKYIFERIRRAHVKKEKFRVIVMLPLAPGFEGDFTSSNTKSIPLRSVARYQYLSISRGGHSILEKLRNAGIRPEEYIGFYSLRGWSPFYSKKRQFQNAKKRTMTGQVREDTMFTDAGASSAAPTFPQDNVYSKEPNLWQGTSSQVPESSCNASPSNGQMDYVTEQIYIHSKLMIIDDRIVICGSANLNDRSLLGCRDSEIAVVIEDTNSVPSVMNGKEYLASNYALTLRKRLFAEHLGIPLDMYSYQHMDPLDDRFYFSQWHKTAQKNTTIYRTLFRCVPDDTVTTYEEQRLFVPDPSRVQPGHIAIPEEISNEQVYQQLKEIQGHIVLFPTNYLCRESLESLTQNVLPNLIFC